MRFLTHFGLAALMAAAVEATVGLDTSPFFAFSTRDVPFPSADPIPARTLLSDLRTVLAACPSDFYVLLQQPGAHVSDYQAENAVPQLRARVHKADGVERSAVEIGQVVPEGDVRVKNGIQETGEAAEVVMVRKLKELVQRKCAATPVEVDGTSGNLPPPKSYGQGTHVIDVHFQPLSAGPKRAEQLSEHDNVLASLLELLPSSNYTVLYTSTPRNWSASDTDQDVAYDAGEEFDSQSALHLHVQRDLADHSDNGNKRKSNKTGVFGEEFFTPGIYMTFMAVLLFVLILYVAINSLASLEVSYGAFSKENGPTAAARKAQ